MFFVIVTKLSVALYDIKGALIHSSDKSKTQKGENKISLALNQFLESGVYILDAKIDGERINKKIYVQ